MNKLGLAAVIAIGFVIRYALLWPHGMFDIDQYIFWGNQIRGQGLMGFSGTYFPLQYQLFALAAAMHDRFGFHTHTAVKMINLVFETGTLACLLDLAGGRKLLIACSYWLNPFFLALFVLGYCDFQIAFFVVASIWALHRFGPIAGSLTAGASVGAAFLMKPQALVVSLAIGLFAAVSFRPKLILQALLIGVPVIAIFVGYSLAFMSHGTPATYLAGFYLNASAVMTAVTAHMVNLWYPLAVLVCQPRQEHLLHDDVLVIGTHSYRSIAMGLMFALLILYLFALARSLDDRWADSDALLQILGIATLLLPMTMTQAHENHLFVGALLLLLMIARGHFDVPAMVAITVLLTVQTLNLVGTYGLGDNDLSSWAIETWIPHLWRETTAKVVFGFLSLGAWMVVLRALFARVSSRVPRWYPYLGPALTIAVVAVVYLMTWLHLAQIRAQV